MPARHPGGLCVPFSVWAAVSSSENEVPRAGCPDSHHLLICPVDIKRSAHSSPVAHRSSRYRKCRRLWSCLSRVSLRVTVRAAAAPSSLRLLTGQFTVRAHSKTIASGLEACPICDSFGKHTYKGLIISDTEEVFSALWEDRGRTWPSP